MTIFYTVDRRKILKPNIDIELQPLPKDNNVILEMFSKLYPEGLSYHGNNYFLNTSNLSILHINYEDALKKAKTLEVKKEDEEKIAKEIKDLSINATSDFIFELVRKAYYPKKPSRYQSMFAWETLHEAKSFKNDKRYCENGCDIFKISSKNNNTHRGDMNLVGIGGSIPVLLYNALLYWEGKTFDSDSYIPLWEILIPLPAEIKDICY